MEEKEILKLLLPEMRIEYFVIEKTEFNKEEAIIFLSEKNSHPEGFNQDDLLSKGFFEPITVQHLPLRGRS